MNPDGTLDTTSSVVISQEAVDAARDVVGRVSDTPRLSFLTPAYLFDCLFFFLTLILKIHNLFVK